MGKPYIIGALRGARTRSRIRGRAGENGVLHSLMCRVVGLGSQETYHKRQKERTHKMEINGEIVSENVRYADLGLSEPIMKALEKKEGL